MVKSHWFLIVCLSALHLACTTTRQSTTIMVRDARDQHPIDYVEVIRAKQPTDNPFIWLFFEGTQYSYVSNLEGGTGVFERLRSDELLTCSMSGYSTARIQIAGRTAFVESPMPDGKVLKCADITLPEHPFSRNAARRLALTDKPLEILLYPRPVGWESEPGALDPLMTMIPTSTTEQTK